MKAMFVTIMFLGGILLAASGGSWFPWLNFVGVFMLCSVAWATNL